MKNDNILDIEQSALNILSHALYALNSFVFFSNYCADI